MTTERHYFIDTQSFLNPRLKYEKNENKSAEKTITTFFYLMLKTYLFNNALSERLDWNPVFLYLKLIS